MEKFVANAMKTAYSEGMTLRKYIAFVVSVALMLVGSVSVSLAAGGGDTHDSHPEAVMVGSHQEMASKDMDCPAHHDGHKMKDAQCAVACFTMISAVGWHGITFTPLAVAAGGILAAEQFYTTRTPYIPTPPPNFV